MSEAGSRAAASPFEPLGLVTLTTDFGGADGYLGAMKGVMLSISPSLRLHDLAHEIPPQDLARGAEAIAAAAPLFPEGSVHLVVIDPGVGGARLPLAVLAGGQLFIGPDNGVLGPAIEAVTPSDEPALAWDISDHPFARPRASATFHGRDLFAPAAAAVAAGLVSPASLGPPTSPRVASVFAPPAAVGRGAALIATVVSDDRFGNLLTDLAAGPLARYARGASVEVILPEGRVLPLARTYADVEPGDALALIGSHGRVELAIRDGSARATLELPRGARVELRRVEGARS